MAVTIALAYLWVIAVLSYASPTVTLIKRRRYAELRDSMAAGIEDPNLRAALYDINPYTMKHIVIGFLSSIVFTLAVLAVTL